MASKLSNHDLRQLEWLKRVISSPWEYGLTFCILCRTPIGQQPFNVGVWDPGPSVSKRISPPGKHRLVAYVLCDSCHRMPGVLEKVENLILARETLQ